MSEPNRPPVVRTLVLGLASLTLVVASLGIDQTAHNRSEARDLGFGYPVHFASSDFTSYYTSPAYPQTYKLNPWEIPVESNPLTFLASWALVYVVLLGCWLLLRKALTRRTFSRLSRVPPASILIASVTLLAASSAVLGTASAPGSATSTSDAQAIQACADRWNWMNYRGHFAREVVPAKVQARPCRIEVPYRLERADPAYKHYLGTYFPCKVNRFGAFVCPGHAYGLPDDPPRTGFNARFFPRTGQIRLYHPPAAALVTPKPDWVRLYPVDAGFIVPFDRKGRLRPGLRLRGRPSSRTTCTTFASIHERSPRYWCGAGLYCFARSLPPRNGQGLACAVEPGSRTFMRGRLRVLGDP